MWLWWCFLFEFGLMIYNLQSVIDLTFNWHSLVFLQYSRFILTVSGEETSGNHQACVTFHETLLVHMYTTHAQIALLTKRGLIWIENNYHCHSPSPPPPLLQRVAHFTFLDLVGRRLLTKVKISFKLVALAES